MTETSSTPPNQEGEGDPQSRTKDNAATATPAPCTFNAATSAPQARRGERLIVSQTADATDDRTELYLRGPTAYCA